MPSTSTPDVAPLTDDRPTALQRLKPAELIALLAFSMALTALGIDLMLPAFGDIRSSLGLAADSNATAGLVTAYFAGMAVGQLAFGIIADAYGRRRALYIGYVVYGVGALLAVLAPTLPLILASRVLWGIGAAGGRVVTLAVIRDTWSGDKMSRAMSFIMAVFITVPILAPPLGAAIIAVAHWRWTFGVCVIAAIAVAGWAMRLPETLPVEARREPTAARLLEAGKIVVSNRVTVTATLAMVSLYGAFTSWIASSELIISDVFDRGDQFPAIFSGLAATLGVGMLVNAWIVQRFGTMRVTRIASMVYVLITSGMLLVVLNGDGRPAFWAFIPMLGMLFAIQAVLMPNINSIALEPMGAVAGTASAVMGSLQVAGGAFLGGFLDRAFDGSLTPMAVGFLGYGILAALLLAYGRRVSGSSDAAVTEAVPAVVEV